LPLRGAMKRIDEKNHHSYGNCRFHIFLASSIGQPVTRADKTDVLAQASNP